MALREEPEQLLRPVGTPSDVILRPYQERAKRHILACKDRGLDRVLVVMPTGTGKTTLFSALIGEIAQNYLQRSLVVAHRHELLDQAHRRIGQQNPALRVHIDSRTRKFPNDANVAVASVQALGRPGSERLKEFAPGFLIIDEAHHAAAETYQQVMRRFGCYEGQCFTVGVTATPHRMDNKVLHGNEEAIFQEVAFSYTLREAIADGWLTDLKGYRVATATDLSKVRVVRGDYSQKQLQDAVNTEARNEAAFEHWLQVASDRRTIVFCTGIEHAEDVAKLFRSRGIDAESVNGSMPMLQREGVMRRFRRGQTQVLTNVDIATEGFDVPEASCVLMLRPTQSWALYTQMIGRGVRVLPNTIDGLITAEARRMAVRDSDKPDCIVIDIVDMGTGERKMPEREEGAPEKPSLAAVMGLPTDFDLSGHTMQEALREWEKLSPAHRALLFRRPTRFEDLTTTLTAVDMLAELSMPESMVEYSRNAWLKMGDGMYLLPCGSSAMERDRSAILLCDTLGRWSVTIESTERPSTTYECGDELKRAFEIADRKVKDVWPFATGFTSTKGNWRNEPVTDMQRQELYELGVEPTVIELLNSAGQAWSLIQMKRREQNPLF